MFSWTLKEPQCVSQQMKRSQHASTDHNDSNLAVSVKSHNNCFSARRWLEGSQQLRSLSLASLRGSQPAALRTVSVFPSASSTVPGVSRLRSPCLHRSGWTYSCTPGRSTPLPQHRRSRLGVWPQAQASLDEEQRHCCFFRQYLRAMPVRQFLDQVFLRPPCQPASSPQRDAKLVSQGCFHLPSSGCALRFCGDDGLTDAAALRQRPVALSSGGITTIPAPTAVCPSCC